MIELTYGEVIDEAMEIVNSVPTDYVYEKRHVCVYVDKSGDEDCASCLVGRILYGLGLPLNEMSSRETGVTLLIPALKGAGILEMDDASRMFLIVLQRAQDLNVPWSVAVKIAQQAVYAL